MPAERKTSKRVVYLNILCKLIFLPWLTIKYPIKIARAAPAKNPIYEKVPVIEKLEIKKIAVSKPSRKIAKNTTKNIPHEDISMALRAWPSNTSLSLTFLDNQKITYHIKNAVKYKKTASNKACVELFPHAFLACITKNPTKILTKIEAKTPYQSFVKWAA